MCGTLTGSDFYWAVLRKKKIELGSLLFNKRAQLFFILSEKKPIGTVNLLPMVLEVVSLFQVEVHQYDDRKGKSQ